MLRERILASPLSASIAIADIVLTLFQWLSGYLLDGSARNPSSLPIIVLQPGGALIHFYVWTLGTSHLIDLSVLKAIVTSILFFNLNSKLEMAWGIRGNMAYLGFVAVISSVVSSLIVIILFLMSAYFTPFLYNADYCGNGALLVAVLLARIQISSEDRLRGISIALKYLVVPMILLYICCSIFEEMLFSESSFIFQDTIFVCTAFPISYIVLRRFDFSKMDKFMSRRTMYFDDGQFSFEMFFPKPLAPCIRPFTWLLNTIASAGSVTHATTHSLPMYGVSERPTQHNTLNDLKYSRKIDSVSERRRARALKALDQKLAQISKEPESQLDDEDESTIALGDNNDVDETPSSNGDRV